jgi:hypothetical protein
MGLHVRIPVGLEVPCKRKADLRILVEASCNHEQHASRSLTQDPIPVSTFDVTHVVCEPWSWYRLSDRLWMSGIQLAKLR